MALTASLFARFVPRGLAHHSRLEEVDALRGVAAMAVVLYHFLDRHEATIGHVGIPAIWLPWGLHGVHLFFIISGFVIFMTLNRARSSLDFIVARVARLYPAYWAAMFLTVGIVLLSGVPDYRPRSVSEVAANVSMWHSLFGIRHVEGAYWTLYVELCFYTVMVALFATGQLRWIELWLLAALAAAWTWWVGVLLHGDYSWNWRLYGAFGRVIPEIPFFVIGICLFLLRGERPIQALLLLLLAIVTVAIQKGWDDAAVCLVAIGMFALIFAQRANFLRSRLLLWLGAISYSLYLVHNYAGRSLIASLQQSGWSTNISIAAVLLFMIAAAALITFMVERPAQRVIRSWWERRRGAPGPAGIV